MRAVVYIEPQSRFVFGFFRDIAVRGQRASTLSRFCEEVAKAYDSLRGTQEEHRVHIYHILSVSDVAVLSCVVGQFGVK